MQPCNLRFLLEDIFTEPSWVVDEDDSLNPAYSNFWQSDFCDNLEQNTNSRWIFFKVDKKTGDLKIDHIGGTPKDTEIQTVMYGKGYAIANALRWGFNTDLDVAKRLNVSKRTADRIIHPNEQYADTNLNFKNTITVRNLDDDYQHHWVKKPAAHPTKYHKWDWKLQKGNMIGRFKSQTIVDEHSFEQYRIMRNSPVHKMIKQHYGKKSHGFLLQALYQKQRTIAIQKCKMQMMSILMKMFRDKKLNKFNSFTYYLSRTNRFYISLVYKAERLDHIRADWKLPVHPTKFAQIMGSIFNDAKGILKFSPITYSLSLKYYIFDNKIKTTITSAMLYWYLYTHKKYYLIPYPKQFILHQVWMNLYFDRKTFQRFPLSKYINHPDPNPNIQNSFLPRELHKI